MTLTDPTDDELNRAFAEKVAEWRTNPVAGGMYPSGLLPEMNINRDFTVPSFTRSMDAVLPWLARVRSDGSVFSVVISFDNLNNGWRVVIRLGTHYHAKIPEFNGMPETDNLPRACVIALLRAHGVVVEFTK